MANCKHERTEMKSETVFQGPVAREENRRAHGNITRTVGCLDCGATQRSNINQMHVESGPWVMPERAPARHSTGPVVGSRVRGLASSGDQIRGVLDGARIIKTDTGRRFRCSQIVAE